MYQKERQILLSIVSTIVIFGFYSLYVYRNYIAGNPEILDDFTFWGRAFLVLIPITIIVNIPIHIVFAIVNRIVTNEDIPTKDDERDKLIELRAIRIAHWIFVVGFVSAMGAIALGMQPWLMLIIIIGSGFIGCIVSEVAKIIMYRRGF